MKRLAVTLFFTCLYIVYCDAQTSKITVPIPLKNNPIQTDSTKIIKELERTFIRRTRERLWQLSDILHLLCEESRGCQSKLYYANIARSLFVDSTQVLIRQDSLPYKKMSFENFLEHLTKNTDIVTVGIDSIMIPKWNYASIEADTIGVVYVESEMSAVHSPQRFEHVSSELPIVSAETEDGTEWVPLFGDMIVRIKYKNEKTKKNNRICLDAISNKLC